MNIVSMWMSNRKNTLRCRLERLYGPGDYENEIYLQMKQMRTKMFVSLIAGLGILFGVIHQDIDGTQNVALSQDGQIGQIGRPDEQGNPVIIDAIAVVGEGQSERKEKVQILVMPYGSGTENASKEETDDQYNKEEETSYAIQKTLYPINKDTGNRTIALPNVLADGRPVAWYGKQNPQWPYVLVLTPLLVALAIRQQEEKGKKEIREAVGSVVRELPGFANKLVLLMNAGLVFPSAFQQLLEDYMKYWEGKQNYFYGQLKVISSRCAETKEGLHLALNEFSLRTGVPEFIRMTKLFEDSVEKGTDLVDQLRIESNGLWFARKKAAEERGKLAETKMTLPLVILLLVLVVVTVAPALLEM